MTHPALHTNLEPDLNPLYFSCAVGGILPSKFRLEVEESSRRGNEVMLTDLPRRKEKQDKRAVRAESGRRREGGALRRKTC